MEVFEELESHARPRQAVLCLWSVAEDFGACAVQVDITVNNILAIVNTKLLADYVSIDERLLQLCYVIKHWAKRRQVCPL